MSDPTNSAGETPPEWGVFPVLKLKITTPDQIEGFPIQVEVVYEQVVSHGQATGREPLPPVEGPEDTRRESATSGASLGSLVSDLDFEAAHRETPGAEVPASTSEPAPPGAEQPAPDTERPSADTTSATEIRPPDRRQKRLVFPLDPGKPGQQTTTERSLANVYYESTISIQFLGSDGIPRLPPKHLEITSSESNGVGIVLTAEEISVIQEKLNLPKPRPASVSRTAIFIEVSLGDTQSRMDFARARLLTAPLDLSDESWASHGFPGLFDTRDGPGRNSTIFTKALPEKIAALPWTTTRLGVDGRFTATFTVPKSQSINGWAWLLTGNRSHGMLGVIYPDKISEGDPEEDLQQLQAILLPQPAQDGQGGSNATSGTGADGTHGDSQGRVPVVVSETELANNPEVYTEDPGSFCKPFRNPERILSERSLCSVLRVDQPDISAAASGEISGPVLDSEASVLNSDRSVPQGLTQAAEKKIQISSGLFNSSLWSESLSKMEGGRGSLDSLNPVQWEGDIFRYQATTLAKGHILEFRVRTRSNGYSLGSVAKTITLAPRQTKRIQKVEWARSEQASRAEMTRLADTMDGGVVHDTTYRAAASASLSEWSQGSSSGKTGGSSGGFGFASNGFVIGGGGTRGTAKSSSQQSGGRTVAASEESQWRDAIRHHGDSLRRLESMVVQEVTQTESVTGTVETLRNINYGHGLTMIYHNILRHLRVDTEFSSARECLFVPFAIRPFTKERVLRFKQSIRLALRDPSFSRALTYFKDVITNFASSSIPPSRLSDHPVKILRGSLYVQLAIARPADLDDGKYNEETWKTLSEVLPASTTTVYHSLEAVEVGLRDQTFQDRWAPTIAAGWCDALEFRDSSDVSLGANFTLATPYKFNDTLRVDFEVPQKQGVSRETLSAISIVAKQGLSPGSKAHAKGLEVRYETDFHQGSIAPHAGVQDLISSVTGSAEDSKASFTAYPSIHERQELRQELRLAVGDFIDHLNEHVEHYHRAIWWNMDRDRLFMLLDGFTVPGLGNAVSVANVVERDPVAVAGNSLVFRVSNGIFLGNPELSIDTAEHLYDYYNSNKAIAEPMHISLPTDGLYGQAIMDECSALEEHHGNRDWALTDPDPDLTAQDPAVLRTRKSDAQNTTPTTLPGTIINIPNSSAAPSPPGLADVLGAVQNASAFRDMAGLAETQRSAQNSLNAAAALATNFGNSAAALEMSRLTGKQQATADADKKVSSIQQARDKRLISGDQAAAHVDRVLGELAGPQPIRPPYESPEVQGLLGEIREGEWGEGSTFETSNAAGRLLLASGTGTTAAPRPTGRPTWSSFEKVYWNYVKYSAKEVLESIDKRWLDLPEYQNTCALRLSKALEDYGTPILGSANRIPGVETNKALSGKRYLLRVDQMRAYLTHQWGTPEVNFDKTQGKPFDPLSHPGFKRNPGVIIFKIKFPNATGHVDLWYGDKFSQERNDGGSTYWRDATNIMLWHLKDPRTGFDGDSGEVVV